MAEGKTGGEITAIAKKKLKERERREKLKGIVKKLAFSHKNPQPGSIGERVGTAYQNRKTFNALKDDVSVQRAREDNETRTENQRRIRTEYKRQKSIKKDKDKKFKNYQK